MITTRAAGTGQQSYKAEQRSYKIAMFSYGLPCPGEKRGGIEQVAHDLANALVDRGHAVTVFTYDRAPSTARYATGPLPFRSFVNTWFGRRATMGYLGNLFALGPGYRDADVVIAHGDSLLLPLCGRPVIRIMQGTAWQEARSATSVGRAILQSGVYVQELLTTICQSGTVAGSVNTTQFHPFIRRVIPNGIDLKRFQPALCERTAYPSILFVGALTGRKRGQWLLDRFDAQIRREYPDAQLHMVTPPGPAVRGVTYHTGLAVDALARLYKSCWVYASPSTYEGFGLPYVEAMACGTPVVATPNPGSREVTADGAYGCLATDEQFVGEVLRLFRDAGERERRGREGLARAQEYDIARSALRYEDLIRELVGT